MKKKLFLTALIISGALSVSACNLLPTMDFSTPQQSSSSQIAVSSQDSSSSSKQSSSKDSSSSSSKESSSSSEDSYSSPLPDTSSSSEPPVQDNRCKTVRSHNWMNVITTLSSDGQVGYSIDKCSYCSAQKLEFKAIDGVLADNSAIKSGAPSGFVKLSGAGQSISYSFRLDEGMYGTIYMKACNDISNTTTKNTYFTTSSGSATTADEGNFRLEVNGTSVDYSHMRTSVDYSHMRDISYAEL